MSLFAPAPIAFTFHNVEARPVVRASFQDDPDVCGTYESPYPVERSEQVKEAKAVMELARLRADMIWTSGAPYEEKVNTIALMLTVLGFIIRD